MRVRRIFRDFRFFFLMLDNAIVNFCWLFKKIDLRKITGNCERVIALLLPFRCGRA